MQSVIDLLFLVIRFSIYCRCTKVRVKRRFSHAPNQIAALSSTQERRLTWIKFDKELGAT